MAIEGARRSLRTGAAEGPHENAARRGAGPIEDEQLDWSARVAVGLDRLAPPAQLAALERGARGDDPRGKLLYGLALLGTGASILAVVRGDEVIQARAVEGLDRSLGQREDWGRGREGTTADTPLLVEREDRERGGRHHRPAAARAPHALRRTPRAVRRTTGGRA